MTGEEMERAIESLINHHAKISSDIQELKEAQKITTAKIASLSESNFNLKEQPNADRRDIRKTINIMSEEMRDRFNKLILSNEITRDLSNQVARLASRNQQTSEGSVT